MGFLGKKKLITQNLHFVEFVLSAYYGFLIICLFGFSGWELVRGLALVYIWIVGNLYVESFVSSKFVFFSPQIMASSLNGLTVEDPLPENLMESPARSESMFYLRYRNLVNSLSVYCVLQITFSWFRGMKHCIRLKQKCAMPSFWITF